MDTIGKRIRAARKANNLTLIDIKNITGLSTGNLSEQENDKFLPSANALIQFKKLFNVSIDWILTGEEPNYATNPQAFNEMKEAYIISEYTEDEIKMIESYRKLDYESKQNLKGYLAVVLSTIDNR